MERLTHMHEGKYYANDNAVNRSSEGYSGEAINRLGVFENVYEDLLASQSEISDQLASLRNEGKEKSVKFKELMVKKLTNINTIILLKSYGLE